MIIISLNNIHLIKEGKECKTGHPKGRIQMGEGG
jgi:hypothetical protein